MSLSEPYKRPKRSFDASLQLDTYISFSENNCSAHTSFYFLDIGFSGIRNNFLVCRSKEVNIIDTNVVVFKHFTLKIKQNVYSIDTFRASVAWVATEARNASNEYIYGKSINKIRKKSHF